jgi:hypothetical protein
LPFSSTAALLNPVNQAAFTGRAFPRPACAVRYAPGVLAFIAQKRSLFSHLDHAAFHAKSQTSNQDLRHFPPRSLDNSTEGLP